MKIYKSALFMLILLYGHIMTLHALENQAMSGTLSPTIMSFISQNLRQLSTIDVTYYTGAESPDGSFLKTSKVHWIKDFNTGEFKIDIATMYDKSLVKRNIYSWFKQKFISLSYLQRNTGDIDTVEGIAGNISQASIQSNKIGIYTPLAEFLDYSVGTSAYTNILASLHDGQYKLSSNEISLTITDGPKNDWKIFFNKDDGVLNKMVLMSGDKSKAFNDIKLLKSFIKDGWILPQEFDYYQMPINQNGSKITSRYMLDTSKCSINNKLSDDLFAIQFPVGCSVNDTISGRQYRIDGINAFDANQENIIHHLDSIIEDEKLKEQAK